MQKVLQRWVLFTIVLMMAVLPTCAEQAGFQRYAMHFFDTFDTVVTLIGYAKNQEVFDDASQMVQDRFTYLHQLFDKYNTYEGVNNLYTLNHEAANSPVKVAPELMELLSYCKKMQKEIPDTVNIALGSVLSVWHDYRDAGEANPDEAALPSSKELEEAAKHVSMKDVILDEKNGTVCFTDPLLSLDLGAVAKGYTAQSAADLLLQSDMPSFILNAGGNVITGNAPLDGRSAWGVSIQDPFKPVFSNDSTIDTVYLNGLSLVTSGINQRYYEVNGTRYHHLIDPNTLYPANHMASITIITQSSLLADYLSTAVFLLPYEKGRALVDSLEGVEALWVLMDGTVATTKGLTDMLKSQGATNMAH